MSTSTSDSRAPAESWEDDSMSDTEVGVNAEVAASPTSKTALAKPITTTQPVTPLRTRESIAPLYGPDGQLLSSSGIAPPPNTAASSRVSTPSQRPEKTASTASRLIAGALGQRAPKRTEEQRAYDQAAREKLRKAKEQEKAREEEARRAREAVWDD